MSARAMMTAAAQLRRILHVVPCLADGESHSLDEVAERAGVSRSTLQRDLWSLVTRFQEPPGGFVDGVQLYIESDRVELASDHFRRPMRLTVSELRAIELGLAMLRAERPRGEQDAVDRARERLSAVLAKLPSDPVPDAVRDASFGEHGDTEHLAVVRAALRSHRKLDLVYRKGDAERASERVVCPYALAAVSGALYIVAHCELNGDIRIFRLDRVEGAKLLPDRFTVPKSFSLDNVLSNGRALASAGPPRVLRVRYSPRVARWIAEREGVKPAADGSLTMEYPLMDSAWAIRHVLRYGPDAEVLEPEDVREELRLELEEMASNF